MDEPRRNRNMFEGASLQVSAPDEPVSMFELAATVAPYLAAAGVKACSAAWWVHVVEGGRGRPSFGRARSEARLAVIELGRAIDILDAIEEATINPPGAGVSTGPSPATGGDDGPSEG